MVTTLLPLICAIIISLITLPAIITVAYRKRLVDDPRSEARKVHRYSVPNLGGVAVFSTFAFISCLFVNDDMLRNANFIFASGIVIFTIGLKDDLMALDPYKKFVAQFLTAFIVVYFADIRITNLYGVMGIYDIGNILSYTLTCFVFVFIINAFNLIDGINGLLGSISSLICITFGLLFYLMDEKGLSILSFSMAGSVVGFLYYNLRQRARIFMGDAGAYSIGFIIAILSIRFIELNQLTLPQRNTEPFTHAAPGIAMALLILPTFDTLRVFALRILRGKSPFIADRNHLHHRLLDLGLTHLQATFTMVAVNFSIIGLAFALEKKVQPAELVVIIILAILFYNMCLWVYEVRNADTILALQRERLPISSLEEIHKQSLKQQMASAPITLDSSSLAEANVLAGKEQNSAQEIEAAKRFTQEMLNNLERSKN